MGRMIEDKWRWRNARDMGVGIAVMPFHWGLSVRRYATGSGWNLTVELGPLLFELSVWARGE